MADDFHKILNRSKAEMMTKFRLLQQKRQHSLHFECCLFVELRSSFTTM